MIVRVGELRRLKPVIETGEDVPRGIIDISVALRAGIASDPPYMLPSISYLDHKAGAENFVQVFPGLKREQLPDQAGPAVETGR